MKTIIFIIFLIYLYACQTKILAGEPKDFRFMTIPKPQDIIQKANSFLKEVKFIQKNNLWEWELNFPVDSLEKFVISIISLKNETYQIVINTPNLLQQDVYTSTGSYGLDGVEFPSTSYIMNNPEAGLWYIKITSKKYIKMFALFDSVSKLKLYSHLNTYNLHTNKEVGVIIKINDEILNKTVKNTIQSAILDVTSPNNTKFEVEFLDDGLHQDGLANDGIYGALFIPDVIGEYTTTAVVHGLLPSETSTDFYRTASHFFPVIEQFFVLPDTVTITMDLTYVTFQFKSKINNSNNYARVYAQVWRVTALDVPMPIAWIQQIVEINNNTFEMKLHVDWIHRKYMGIFNMSRLQLRNITMFSLNNNILVDTKDIINMNLQKQMYLNWVDVHKTYDITDEMKYGKKIKNTNVNNTVVLVHGYCSGSVWPINEFTNAVEFKDYQQSRSNNDFALLIQKTCGDSCSIIAHSQGGLAALHLKTFYWSGLDNNNKNIKIQSVGSPYHGSSIAGTVANIGKVFGIGCGSQFDLTPDGASLWLSTIPPDSRKYVNYYTSTSDNCVFASSLVLYSPNDGTCERRFAILENANDKGNKDGWCHTTGMNSPAQYNDKERNIIMNADAQ